MCMHKRDFRLPRKTQNAWVGNADCSKSYQPLSWSIGPDVCAEPAAAVGEYKFIYPWERAFAGSCVELVIDGQPLHMTWCQQTTRANIHWCCASVGARRQSTTQLPSISRLLSTWHITNCAATNYSGGQAAEEQEEENGKLLASQKSESLKRALRRYTWETKEWHVFKSLHVMLQHTIS